MPQKPFPIPPPPKSAARARWQGLRFSSFRNLSRTCLRGGAAFAVQPTAWHTVSMARSTTAWSTRGRSSGRPSSATPPAWSSDGPHRRGRSLLRLLQGVGPARPRLPGAEAVAPAEKGVGGRGGAAQEAAERGGKGAEWCRNPAGCRPGGKAAPGAHRLPSLLRVSSIEGCTPNGTIPAFFIRRSLRLRQASRATSSTRPCRIPWRRPLESRTQNRTAGTRTVPCGAKF